MNKAPNFPKLSRFLPNHRPKRKLAQVCPKELTNTAWYCTGTPRCHQTHVRKEV